MSWSREIEYRWYEKLAMNIIKAGPIPRHVAFIMDGNRRYARNANIDKKEGHSRGFEKLTECLQWCLDVGIKEVTTFAFSIENFKRSDDEVSALLGLAREKIDKLLEEEDKLKEKGVCVRVIGNLTLLPTDLQTIIARAVLATENNNQSFLNIAISYTSRDEITKSFQTIIEADDDLEAEDIDEELIEKCLYTRNSPPPDLLIRTSGENRISDFLMWQISGTALYFSNILWPALTLWHFLYGVFYYQRFSIRKPESRLADRHESKKQRSDRVENFLKKVDSKRRQYLVDLIKSNE
uniref:Alkyl transferase n=1 Tax=Tabanus bromius TaxID=304241 RepID=A0A0K8TTW0_TABBR